ncbi:hypothetical protein JOC78_003378 [Bacillus ectoiniformans]|uniref:hypothetical protein n=1 Tax=Bacillus ectoiniformans TaxID=1494429 RepID=UPI00195B5E6F|nr:hypothetical protein [Bacillus ectoiniformans]MBM7650388.1 hypothetical protein [Bacillus ectoiniformans]
MHKSNRSKTGLEENLITIQDKAAQTVALHLKGIESQEIAKRLSIEIGQEKEIIKVIEEK